MHLLYFSPVREWLCPFVGIAAAGYHHVNYFKGVDAREKYDSFFEKVLKVKDVAMSTFAERVQRLLVDYIRYFNKK